MSKQSPFSSLKYHPPIKHDRLYFPKNGDTGLFSECGRKHFVQKISFPTPYASIINDLEFDKLLKLKKKQVDDMPPIRLSTQQISTLSKNTQQKHNQHSGRNNYNEPMNALDLQVHQFDYNRRLPNQQNILKNDYPTIDSRRRVQTQVSCGKMYQNNKLQYPMDRYQNMTPVRLKTEQNTSIPKQSRFNPTFLSSLNY